MMHRAKERSQIT